jgi:hypothetical protein
VHLAATGFKRYQTESRNSNQAHRLPVSIAENLEREKDGLAEQMPVGLQLGWSCIVPRFDISPHVVSAAHLPLQDVKMDDKYKKVLMTEVCPPKRSCRFRQHRSAGPCEDTLRELMMLPLHRPQLFQKGQLTRVG